MKKKFIFPLMAVMLVIALLAFTLPMVSALPDAEAVEADEGVMLVTADLAEVDSLFTVPTMASEVDVGIMATSESVLISETAVPGQVTSEPSLWIALSVTLCHTIDR